MKASKWKQMILRPIGFVRSFKDTLGFNPPNDRRIAVQVVLAAKTDELLVVA